MTPTGSRSNEESAPPSRWRLVLGCLLAALVFYSVFWVGYRQIDSDLYRNRDDGIITVSHARNLVEYGSIGVNPSGERVEGYSSPLQLLLFSATYALTEMHYDFYFRLVASFSAFAIGVLLYLLCMPHGRLGLLMTALAAVALVFDFSFFEWHASGMENPLFHALFLLSVVVLVHMFVRQRIQVGFALVVFAASIARIESIYHVAPLLALFAIMWCVYIRDARGLGFVALVAVLWSAFFFARWHYFGHVFPNTAGAQDISLSDRLRDLVARDPNYLRHASGLAKQLFYWHHGMLLLPILACLPFFRFNRRSVFALLLLASLIITSLFSPFLFGPARLDVTRLSTHMALAVVALAMVVTLHTRRTGYRYITVPLMICSVASILYVGYARWDHRPYYLWFSEDVFAEFREPLLEMRDTYDIPRPRLANPDLGLMSWHKDFNIVDMGFLGSPVLTRLDGTSLAARRDMAHYFFDIAAPDLVELHGVWSERHAHLFKDPRFRENYHPVKVHADGFIRRRFQRDPTFALEYGDYVRAGYWVRKDMMPDSGSAERKLVDDLRAKPSIERLREEFGRCEVEGDTAMGALYILRSAYRFLPEFVALGSYDELLALFETYQPAFQYPVAPLRGRTDPRWVDDMVQFVRQYGPQRTADSMAFQYREDFDAGTGAAGVDLEITSGLTLVAYRLTPDEGGWGKLQLQFACTEPVPGDWKLFIHGAVSEERRGEMPASRRQFGFMNWDLGYPIPPTSQWHAYGRIVLSLYVPHHQLANAMTVGLYQRGQGSYGTPVTVPLEDNRSLREAITADAPADGDASGQN